MKNKIIIGIIVLVIGNLHSSCMKHKLLRHYQKNKVSHHVMAASAKRLAQSWSTDFLIKKIVSSKQTMFLYMPDNGTKYAVINYDSLGNEIDRSDDNLPGRQAPQDLLKEFNKSIYHAMKIDSSGIFLAYEYENSSSEYEVGVFISFDTAKTPKYNVLSKVSDSVFVIKAIVP